MGEKLLREELLDKLDDAVIEPEACAPRGADPLPLARLRYQICVSGGRPWSQHGPGQTLAGAEAPEIVLRGHIVLTGATRGLPFYAARPPSAASQMTLPQSVPPAASRLAHVKVPASPRCLRTILYTGFEYTGLNLSCPSPTPS